MVVAMVPLVARLLGSDREASCGVLSASFWRWCNVQLSREARADGVGPFLKLCSSIGAVKPASICVAVGHNIPTFGSLAGA